MFRLSFGLVMVALVGGGSTVSTRAPVAWPHRAIVTSLHGQPVTFRAYTLGGEFIIAVDRTGRRTSIPSAVPTLRALTAKDTIRAETPADFALDLSKGPVVFLAEGHDSLHLVVGKNPFGSIDQVTANGRKFTVRFVSDRFVIDTRCPWARLGPVDRVFFSADGRAHDDPSAKAEAKYFGKSS